MSPRSIYGRFRCAECGQWFQCDGTYQACIEAARAIGWHIPQRLGGVELDRYRCPICVQAAAPR